MRKNLTLIDDDASILSALKGIYEQCAPMLGVDLTVTTFPDTREARRVWEASGFPDVVLSDMRIPNDLGGPEETFWDVSKRGVRMMFMTGHISLHDEGVRQRTGGEVFLKLDTVKDPPVFLAHLLETCVVAVCC